MERLGVERRKIVYQELAFWEGTDTQSAIDFRMIRGMAEGDTASGCREEWHPV